VNEISFCYSCSPTYELLYNFEGFINYFYILFLSCSLVNEYHHSKIGKKLILIIITLQKRTLQFWGNVNTYFKSGLNYKELLLFTVKEHPFVTVYY